jgi:hypothetical protein
MKLIDFDVLKKMVEQRFDMQDLYLPIHFLEIAEELAEKGLWTTFKKRELTPLEKGLKPDWCYILDDVPGYDEDAILVTDGKDVWSDYFVNNGTECYLDSGREIENGMAWMYMPEPYKEAKEHD